MVVAEEIRSALFARKQTAIKTRLNIEFALPFMLSRIVSSVQAGKKCLGLAYIYTDMTLRKRKTLKLSDPAKYAKD